MANTSFDLNYLSPNGFIGFWVLLIGFIFTGIMFYFVFFKIKLNDNSYNDKNKKELEKQKERIAKLYPKNNEINHIIYKTK